MTRPEEVQAALQTVESMYSSGALPDDSYHKCLVTLASEWLCNHDDGEQAVVLLNRCPPSYYALVLPGQLKEDGMFADAVMELVYRVLKYGIVNVDLHPPTMPPARA